jgi:hypothetical protein
MKEDQVREKEVPVPVEGDAPDRDESIDEIISTLGANY